MTIPRAVGVIIAISLTVHLVTLILGKTTYREWRVAHYPIHTALEISGSLIALTVAWILMALERRGEGTNHNAWISGALIGMGLLDGFHGIAHAGETFVWLHSAATFLGGLLLMLVWLPATWFKRQKRWWPGVVFVISFHFGVASFVFPDVIPAMLTGDESARSFTFWAKALNVLGGGMLFLAAARLVQSYRATHNEDDLLFCLHCALFGAAAVMFEQSELWDLPWWGWHTLRLMAYAVAFLFVMRAEQRTQKRIRETRDELRRLNDQLEARAKTAELEIAAAAQIQSALLPKSAPQIPGYEIAGVCVPAETASGDFYDFIRLRDGSWGLVVGDVSSHGLGPAMIVAGTRRLIRTMINYHDDLGDLLTRANKAVFHDTQSKHYVTLFIARLDPLTGQVEYAGAGHAAYLLDGDSSVRLDSTGCPLGLHPDLEIEQGNSHRLKPGQLLVLPTDGFQEARPPGGDLFRVPPMLNVIRSHRQLAPEAILQRLVSTVNRHCHPGNPKDDMTAVIVKAHSV